MPTTIDVHATVVSMLVLPQLSCVGESCRDESGLCYIVPDGGNVEDLQPVKCPE